MPLLEMEAIVMNSLKLGEADKLITFYSSRLGKIKAVAKGARKIKNKYGSALEPFTHNRLIIYDKRPQILYRIFQSDIIESFQGLRTDYDKIIHSSLFCRLIQSFSAEGDPSPSIFNLFLKLLNYLKEFKASASLINLFTLKLIEYAGYKICLDHCAKCQGQITGSFIHLCPVAGGLLCSSCKSSSEAYSFPVSMAALAVLKQTFKMEPDLIFRLRPSDDVTKEISHILEIFIFHVLGRKIPLLPISL